MTHRNLGPEKILPGQLLLRTEGACDLDQQQLLDVWARQRQRFVAVVRGFGPYDWVGRHLRDCNTITAGTDEHALDLAAGLDPRITPRGWLVVSPAPKTARTSR